MEVWNEIVLREGWSDIDGRGSDGWMGIRLGGVVCAGDVIFRT